MQKIKIIILMQNNKISFNSQQLIIQIQIQNDLPVILQTNSKKRKTNFNSLSYIHSFLLNKYINYVIKFALFKLKTILKKIMRVTLTTQNRLLQKQNKNIFINQLQFSLKKTKFGKDTHNNVHQCLSKKLKQEFNTFIQNKNEENEKIKPSLKPSISIHNKKKNGGQFLQPKKLTFLKDRFKDNNKMTQDDNKQNIIKFKNKNKNLNDQIIFHQATKQYRKYDNVSKLRLQTTCQPIKNPQQQKQYIKVLKKKFDFINGQAQNHSTKDNSREKSRAQSIENSITVIEQALKCCGIRKESENENQNQNHQEWKQIRKSRCKQKFIQGRKNEQKMKFEQKQKQKQKKIKKITSPQITKNIRIIMLDWMYQLSAEIQLPRQALYNSIDYVDKYVSLAVVKKTQYQTVGLACLFLATKLQTSSHPKIQTFLLAMDNQIDRSQLINAQKQIVNKLKFKLNPPTLYQYMTLALFTLKSFKSLYKNIKWLEDLPAIYEKSSYLHHRLFWILDGIIIEGQTIYKYEKQQICLAILYVVMKEQKIKIQKCKMKTIHQTNNINDIFLVQKSQWRLYESTLVSEQPMNCYNKSSQVAQQKIEKEIQKFNISFECFMSYATTSKSNLSHIQSCISNEGLQKWISHSCACKQQHFLLLSNHKQTTAENDYDMLQQYNNNNFNNFQSHNKYSTYYGNYDSHQQDILYAGQQYNTNSLSQYYHQYYHEEHKGIALH